MLGDELSSPKDGISVAGSSLVSGPDESRKKVVSCFDGRFHIVFLYFAHYLALKLLINLLHSSVTGSSTGIVRLFSSFLSVITAMLSSSKVCSSADFFSSSLSEISSFEALSSSS